MVSHFHKVPQCDNLDQMQMVTHWGPVFKRFLTSLAQGSARFEANGVSCFVSPLQSLLKFVSTDNPMASSGLVKPGYW